jgi:hypothetical protein
MVARMEGLALSAQLAIAHAGAYVADPEWWTGMSDGSPAAQLQALTSLELFTRNAFLSSLFATFENGCRIALRHLYPLEPQLAELPAHRVFSKLEAALPTVPKDAWPLVELLRHTRNSLHNNGIVFDSREPLRTVDYFGVSYRFEHGKPIAFATWHFLTRRFLELGILSCIIVSAPGVVEADAVLDPAYQ